MTRSGNGWLASAATSCVTATWDLVLMAGDNVDSWVPTGTTLLDDGDSGLIGKITNVKVDFVGITVSGMVCDVFHTVNWLLLTIVKIHFYPNSRWWPMAILKNINHNTSAADCWFCSNLILLLLFFNAFNSSTNIVAYVLLHYCVTFYLYIICSAWCVHVSTELASWSRPELEVGISCQSAHPHELHSAFHAQLLSLEED